MRRIFMRCMWGEIEVWRGMKKDVMRKVLELERKLPEGWWLSWEY